MCNFGSMKLINIFALLLLWTVHTDAHPLHLSIANITYENGMLKISMKTFRDDWETAYFHYHSAVIDLSDPAKRENPWLLKYLEDGFRISTTKTGHPFEMTVDTLMLDEDSMTIEMHVAVPGDPKSLYIYNALLTDIYPDQTNLVIFGFKNRETGIKFDVKNHDSVMLLK